MGDGPRRLQRGRRRLALLPARPRPLAGVPLERGRPGRDLRRSSRACAWRLALWNGRDPILKERLFGLTGHEGNHGEDAKEYWWYLDATPSHSWLRWRYHYPQGVPVRRPRRRERPPRTRVDPEYELLDTGVFDDDRYWVVEVTYAKAGPTDVLMNVSSHQRRAGGRHPARPADRCGSATPGRGRRRRAASRRPTGTNAGAAVRNGDLRPSTSGRRLPLAAAPGPDGSSADAAVLRQRDQRAAAVRGRRRRRRTRRTASTTTSSPAPRPSTRTARDQGGVVVPAGRPGRETAELRLWLFRPPGDEQPGWAGPLEASSLRSDQRRPRRTSSTPASPRPVPARTRPW